MVTPTSNACRRAAGDVTTYNSIVGSLTSAVAVVMALTLGSLSDSVGRRGIFIIKGALSVCMLYALALHQLAGYTLWIFLLIRPLGAMWDSNGVSMALMADVIPERSIRAAAMSITIALILIIALACLLLAGLLPVGVSFTLALIAGTLKIVFLFTIFPETMREPPSHDARSRQHPMTALIAAIQIITRNSFILRMACIAVIGGTSTAGTWIVAQPYLTSYIGMQRQQLASLMAAMIVSVLFTLGAVSKPLTAQLGDVRTYQVCLLGVALMPVVLCICKEPWHVMIATSPLMGFICLQIPILSAIKSNLVSDAEQGLVQGALASLGNMASAVAAPLFGWLYNYSTDRGANDSRSAAFPPLLVASAVGVAAFLVSLSLPLKVPDPDIALSETLLRVEHEAMPWEELEPSPPGSRETPSVGFPLSSYQC